MSAGFMVVTIAKDYLCSKKVTVINLIGHVVCNIYDRLLEAKTNFTTPKKNVPALTEPFDFMIR